MKGLLVKDLNILLLQKKFLGVVLIIAAIVLMTMEDPSFLIGYITVLCGIVTVSTINYDDFDNGNTFLFTLPITRKLYVLEKYVLLVAVSGCAWLVSTMVSIVILYVRTEGFIVAEGIAMAVLTFVVCMLIEFIMVPIQLKYGGEKSKVVMVTIVGIVVVMGYFLKYISKRLEGIVSIDVEGLLNAVESIGISGWVLIAVCACVVVMLISIVVSEKIMEKKQF